jgi:hypothetical protein
MSLLTNNQNRQNGFQDKNSVMRAAFLAMMSGQSPQEFLKTLPQCQGMDLSNLTEASKKLCKSKGINYEQAKQSVSNEINTISKER